MARSDLLGRPSERSLIVADAGRVITGTAKGTRLMAPGIGTRPLGDRVKQALFAALEGDLADVGPTPFLDLYAGSGAAGVEALSRGSPLAVFVERDVGAARTIAENLRRTALSGGTVVRRDVLAWLRDPEAKPGSCFGAVFIDPPYDQHQALLDALAALGAAPSRWLADGAVVVAKHFWRYEPAERIGGLSLMRRRRFGETALSYYRHYTIMEVDHR